MNDQTVEFDGQRTSEGRDPAALRQMVARLFDHWRLSDGDRAALLGQSEPPQVANASVAGNESAERIGHLLAIHAQLRTLFPENRDLAYNWISTPNLAFDGSTPVGLVRVEGLGGLRSLRAYLDQAICS